MGPVGECGLCGCGLTAGCNWSIDFAGGELTWNRSDYWTTEAYSCSNGTILGASGDPIATYDAVADTVSLAGDVYDACAGDCAIAWVGCDEVCPDFCADVSGHGFRTTEHYECGLCPNDQLLMCRWTVTFTGDEYEWAFSDGSVDGAYTCDNALATITDVDSGAEIGELYTFGDTGEILWDGLVYEPCGEGGCDPDYIECDAP